MTSTADRDPERDAYLSEALRHAPDAALAPPAALSDAILRQARSATAASIPADASKPAAASLRPARAPRRPIADFWLWLARPQVAGGFASVLAATLVGMLWWDRPMDDAMPRAPAPSTAPSTPPSTATPAPARSDAPGQAMPLPPADLRANSGETKPVPSSSAKPTPEVHTHTPAPTHATQRVDKATATESATDAAPRTTATTPAAAPSPAGPMAAAPMPPAPAMAAAPALRDELKAATDTVKNKRAPVAQVQASAFDKASRNAAGAAAGSLARSTESSEARRASLPLRNLRLSLGEEPQRWTWQRDAGSAQPIDAALRMWLTRLESALAGSNAEIAAGTTGGDAEASPSDGVQTLRLLRDGRMHTLLRLDGDSVRIETLDDPSAAGTARLRSSTAAALKAAMPLESR